jgi:long-chain acyl-CoA synthetase
MHRLPPGGYYGYLARAAAQWPDRIGLHFDGVDWTYRRLNLAATATAARLAAVGVTAGTRVLLLMENRPEYLIAQFALARLGAVFVTPNPYWTNAEISRAIEASGASAAIHEPRFDTSALALAIPADVVSDGFTLATCPPLQLDWFAPQYIPFSSGTTGMPKGVLHTNASLCGGVQQLQHHLGLSGADRLPISIPLCHIFGTTVSAAAISVGAPITVFRRFDLDEALSHLTESRPTVWPIAGAVAQRLAVRSDLRPEMFSSLRFFIWGGGAVPVALAEQVTTRTGVRFLCSYGMTEAMMVAFNPVDRPNEWRLDSPGQAALDTELRIADNGELQVRGPSVAAGYVGKPSPEFADDGWFFTGDLARIDTDGRLTIVDRLKDVLKVSGFQVAPAEVEEALLSHPAVLDVAVVGRPDDTTGEIPVAVVVTRTPVTPAELDSYLRPQLATYKRPREYRFVASLPRTSGGKLQRALLRAQTAG